MAVTTARINSIFKAFGLSPEEHAAANGETVQEMLARMANQHDQDSLVSSLLRAYPDNGSEFVTNLFGSRNLDIAKGDETEAQRISRIVSELQGGRTFTDLQGSLDLAAGLGGTKSGSSGETVDAGGGVTVKAGAPASESQARGGVGAGGADPATQLTILTGKGMSWYLDNQSGKWYVSYSFGAGNRAVFFEAQPEQMDALFGAGMRPTQYSTKHTLASLSALDRLTFAGNIAEMEGEGTFESEVARVQAIALDNGVLPEWAQKDDAALDWLYVAVSEGKSNDWLVEKLASLPSFKQRFPNLDSLKSTGNLTTGEAITGFLEFESGIKQALVSTGKDPAQVTPQLVGALMKGGHSLTGVQQTVQGFDRMQKFAPAMQAFNSILESQGIPAISNLQGMFDFVSGKAPSQMYDVWEASSIAEATQQAGLGDIFSADDAIAIGLATDHTLESATAASRKAAEMLLRLRHEVDVGKFGLNHEDLIDAAFGRAPRSGVTEAELNENINRAVVGAQAFIQTKRATPYKGFGSTGTIQARSLGNLRPQN